MKATAPAIRQRWMALLATALPARLATLVPELPNHEMLRAPEIGTVMVQGRMGGTGGAFHLGEMTVTRCSLRLDCGTVGHGYVQGRDKVHAQRVAIVDAWMQTPLADQIQREVLNVLEAEAARRQEEQARKSAATKVDFFTMVRGEDA
jgi:alpha-D-ribose 1-methylphosphonate 5-triphosphate synthase subunit PhnG